jgi:hypothetical protein
MLDHLSGLAKTRMMMCCLTRGMAGTHRRPESVGLHDQQLLNVDERIIRGSHPVLGLSTSKQKEKKHNKMELRQSY